MSTDEVRLLDPAPLEPGHSEPLEEYSLLGWPHQTTHECGARAVMLWCTVDKAGYECRGRRNDDDGYPSDYGPDRCGEVFCRYREAYEL